MKTSFSITMEEDLRTEIDRVAAQEDRSRNYVINHLCRLFLSQGAMHPPENPSEPPPHTPPLPPPSHPRNPAFSPDPSEGRAS